MTTQKTIKIELPAPHEKQIEILQTYKRFNVIVAGRRFGKNTVAYRLAVTCALQGYSVGWMSPTNSDARKVFRDLVSIAQPALSRKLKSEKILEFKTGGMISLFSGESPNRVRGNQFKRFIYDEAAFITELEMIHTEIVSPALINLQGDVFWISTPKLKDYFFTLYKRAESGNDAMWKAFHYTAYDNPHIPAEEIDKDKANMTEARFNREYLAIFTDTGANVFRSEPLARACILKSLLGPLPGHKYVFGIDWGRSNDYTVISIFDKQSREQVHLERMNKISFEAQKQRVIDLATCWQPVQILAEQNSIGKPIIESLRTEQIPSDLSDQQKEIAKLYGLPIPQKFIPIIGFETTQDSKTQLIEALDLAFEKGNVKLLDNEDQYKELQAYERLPSMNGKWKFSNPVGGHDDTVIACALALSICDKPERKPIQKVANPFYRRF